MLRQGFAPRWSMRSNSTLSAVSASSVGHHAQEMVPNRGSLRLTFPMAMEDQANEESLVEKARAAIQAGNLPARRPDRTFAGPGSGSGSS